MSHKVLLDWSDSEEDLEENDKCCNRELIEWGEVEDSGQQALSE